MYGWTPDYIRDNLSVKDIEIFYTEGMQSDLMRRGFKIDRKEETQSIEELKDWYWTPEQIKQQEEYKKTLGK